MKIRERYQFSIDSPIKRRGRGATSSTKKKKKLKLATTNSTLEYTGSEIFASRTLYITSISDGIIF